QLGDIVEDDALAVRLVHRHGRALFELTDLDGARSALVDQSHQLLVEFVDLLPPVPYIHNAFLMSLRRSSNPRWTRNLSVRSVFLRGANKSSLSKNVSRLTTSPQEKKHQKTLCLRGALVSVYELAPACCAAAVRDDKNSATAAASLPRFCSMR